MSDAQKIEALLDDSGNLSEAPAEVTKEPVTAPEPEAAPTAEAKPAETTAEQPPEQKPADEPRYKVKVDGKETEVTLAELQSGYQRQADYTHKTQALAEQRRVVDGEKEKLTREREAFVQNASGEMTLLQRQIEADAKKDWPALLNSDPVEYMRQKAEADGRREQYFQLRHQSEQVVNALRQEQEEQQSAYLTEQRDILKKDLPDLFGDEAKSAETRKQLREFMAGIGFSDAEIASVSSAKDVRLIINAMRYNQLEKAKVAEQKRVKEQPAKVESPGARVDDDGSPLNKAAYDRLIKSGGTDTRAAQRAIESLL